MASIQGQEQQKIGELIRERRKKLKMTQTQLGELLGVGKKAVSTYEKGIIKTIPFEKRVKLSEILKVDLYNFLYENEMNEATYWGCVSDILFSKGKKPSEADVELGMMFLNNSPRNIHASLIAQKFIDKKLNLGSTILHIFKYSKAENFSKEFVDDILSKIFGHYGLKPIDSVSLSMFFANYFQDYYEGKVGDSYFLKDRQATKN